MQKATTKNNTWVSWSEDEVKLLKRLFPCGRAREIAEQTGRPLMAVKQKAYSMGIRTRAHRFWSADGIRLLKKLYQDERNVQSIADKLVRTVSALLTKAKKMGPTEEHCAWSKRELNLLKKLYPSRTAQEIADQIGRSVKATQFRIVKLGLRKRRSTVKN